MPSSLHDFTDSEDESEGGLAVPLGESSPATGSDLVSDVRGQSEEEIGSALPQAGTSESRPGPLKITLRPNLNHLMDHEPQPLRPHEASDRSSLSPPPPLTLKLGKPNLIGRAMYSESDSDPQFAGPSSHPIKKRNPSGSSAQAKNKLLPLPPMANPAVDEEEFTHPHRKAYEWLAPSVTGTSHHGPPERRLPRITGWAPPEDDPVASAIDAALGEEDRDESPLLPERKGKGQKRKAAVEPGPGKAWRKGLKKGMPIPWKDGGTFQAGGSIGYSTPPLDGTPFSGEDSPDPIGEPAFYQESELLPEPVISTRPPSPPFVQADPAKLGFPVFSRPIAAPKVSLGPFPKVTQFFAPSNGGDVGPFPRKEKVREWRAAAKTIIGVGGGKLRFKSWARGPDTELAALIRADREVKEQNKHRPKPNTSLEMPNPTTLHTPDRPHMQETPSFDGSTTALIGEGLAVGVGAAAVGGAEGDELNGSEIGDGEESVAGSVGAGAAPSPANSRGRGGKVKAKAKPRKSKLAQEIVSLSVEEGQEDILPSMPMPFELQP